MPSTFCGFSDTADGQGCDLLVHFGPTLAVDIGFDPNYVSDVAMVPDLAAKGLHALVDTGATTSCIDSELAMTLGLPIVDQSKVSGVSGEMVVNMHLAQIYVPSLNRTVYGQFAGVDLAAGGQAHSALIGRTFLRAYHMAYDGPSGQVTISDPNYPLAP